MTCRHIARDSAERQLSSFSVVRKLMQIALCIQLYDEMIGNADLVLTK